MDTTQSGKDLDFESQTQTQTSAREVDTLSETDEFHSCVEQFDSISSESVMQEHTTDLQEVNLAKRGLLEYGCKHYRRRCLKKAPCCQKFFWCRHCHNESVEDEQFQQAGLACPPPPPPPPRGEEEGGGNAESAPTLPAATQARIAYSVPHTLNRHAVEVVKCALCHTEQSPAQVCIQCGVNLGEYFCSICRFYDDTVEKELFHCNKCGICRVGGIDNFFHCDTCECCWDLRHKDSHQCRERSLHQNCPICCEYLFDSIHQVQSLRCMHPIHLHCLEEMWDCGQYTCPVCGTPLVDEDDYEDNQPEEAEDEQVMDQEVDEQMDFELPAEEFE